MDRNAASVVSPQAVLKDCGTPLVEHFRKFTAQQRKLILYRCIVGKLGLLKFGRQLNTKKLREDIARGHLPGHVVDSFTSRSYECDNLRGKEKLITCFDTLCPGLLSSIDFSPQ